MEVHEHPAGRGNLQNALKAALPYSINLVYRTQHPNRTKDAHILSTFSPSVAKTPQCWAAAYIDRSMRPETELWIFTLGESPNHHSAPPSSKEQEFCATCRRAVLSLLDYMATLPIPSLHPDNLPALELAKEHEKQHPTPRPDGSYALSPGAYMRHLLLPKVVTLGCCHQAVVQICREVGILRPEFPGVDADLNKFLFKLNNLPELRELPEGLRWGELRERDIDVVKARTSIPRSTRTLLSLNRVGVFEEETDTPVAWTFLGLDGSLTTLHTEEEYRGKGIAKAVAAKIFRQYAPGLAVDEVGNTAWSHADVYVGNMQSESVCRSLGGKAMWRCYWVRIDLEKAGSLAKEHTTLAHTR
ncbi:Nn.00g054970.m01.CDS01 [Neocucurbitaria sp. VM-36]